MNWIFCCQVIRIKGNATLRVSRDMGRSNRRLILTGLITVRPMHYDPWQQRTMKERLPVSHFYFLWDSKINWLNHLQVVFQFHWRSPYAILLLFFHDELNVARLSLWQSLQNRRLTSYFPKQTVKRMMKSVSYGPQELAGSIDTVESSLYVLFLPVGTIHVWLCSPHSE